MCSARAPAPAPAPARTPAPPRFNGQGAAPFPAPPRPAPPRPLAGSGTADRGPRLGPLDVWDGGRRLKTWPPQASRTALEGRPLGGKLPPYRTRPETRPRPSPCLALSMTKLVTPGQGPRPGPGAAGNEKAPRGGPRGAFERTGRKGRGLYAAAAPPYQRALMRRTIGPRPSVKRRPAS